MVSLKTLSSWTFKVVSLFNYQCTVLSFLSDATLIEYHVSITLSIPFLYFFVIIICIIFYCLLLIAFLMIRRRRDLNPRTARTVYTLSRGASSATWVLLHMPVSIFYTMLFSTSLFSCDARIIIFEIISFVNYFFTFFCHFFISSWKNPPKQCNSALHQSGRLYKSIY